uniref:SH2 domain-containing protein n=1 Tax=Eptatretus burgeri TaxID=7764 RepID=A0A8C4QPC5_EPTBU
MVDHKDYRIEPYHEGYLSTSFDGQDCKWYWVQLHGDTLYFYNGEPNRQYFKQIDLDESIAVETDIMGHLQFQLVTPFQNYWFEVDIMEQVLLWQAIIHTVAHMAMPEHLRLLPGQIIWLQDVIAKETTRRSLIHHPPDLLDFESSTQLEQPWSTAEANTYLSTDELRYPECYYDIKREEAEKRLQSRSGTFLLRPTSDGEHVCVSVKRSKNSMVQHYKILHTAEGYVLHDNKSKVVLVQTLQEIVDHSNENLGSDVKPYSERVTHPVEGQTYDSIRELHSDSARRSRRSSDMPPVLPQKPLPGDASGHESPRERRTIRYPDVAILPDLTTRISKVIDEVKFHLNKTSK